MLKTALVFSGYNQRAVIALCRFFSSAKQDFAIVSAGPDDPIHLTDYKANVVFDRQNRTLTIDLFERISECVGASVYCPTSEFLNLFVLENKKAIERLGIESGMPDKSVYALVTGKKSSQQVLKNIQGVVIPPEMTLSDAPVPCVLRPYENVTKGAVLYPVICETRDELSAAQSSVSPKEYFVQKYISGQSYYVCGYLSKTGYFTSYWQENLVQQANGKSIVFARTCSNPGLKDDDLFGALSATGYHGPVMAEFIKDGDELNYIEINPRFWGPLQLGLDCCDVLSPYLAEQFHRETDQETSNVYTPDIYYSWAAGAKQRDLKYYPAAGRIDDIDSKVRKFDVYNRPDTLALHNSQ